MNEATPISGQVQSSGTPVSAPLRLWAHDAEDLATFSSHLQDALLVPGNAVWLPKQRRFALALSRLDWLVSRDGQWWRREAGLHFDHVLRVERAGTVTPDSQLRLVDMKFAATRAPSGQVRLNFADGQTIRLHVECLESCLRDLGDPELTSIVPTSPRLIPQDRFSK